MNFDNFRIIKALMDAPYQDLSLSYLQDMFDSGDDFKFNAQEAVEKGFATSILRSFPK